MTPLILFAAKEHTIKCPILYNFLVLIFHPRLWWTSLAQSIMSAEETLAEPQTAASVLQPGGGITLAPQSVHLLADAEAASVCRGQNQQETVPRNGVKVE